MIPKNLQHPDFRFCLLGKWNQWRNPKTGETKEFPPEQYDKLVKENIWKPLGKAPFEKDWQKLGYKYDDKRLLKHIEEGKNYGVIGGYGNLRILDIDDVELGNKIIQKLKTFTTQTGRAGKHFFIISEYDQNHVLSDDKGEMRSKNYQVVGPNCRHPNGNYYTIINDMKIAKVDKDLLYNSIEPYLSKNIINDSLDPTRSGVEFRKVIALIMSGKKQEEIFKEMMTSEKWNTSSEKYRLYTYRNALKYAEENKERARAIKLIIDKKEQVKEFSVIQPFFYDSSGIWWLWSTAENKWNRTDEVDILNMIADRTSHDIVGSKNRTELINALKQQGRRNIPKPCKKTWIQFQNKIIDVETLKEFQASCKYFVTNTLPWNYIDCSETPVIDKIFIEWVGEEYKQILYEIIAYSMLPDYPLHKLFCLIGSGSNGKSKYLTLLTRLIGIQNITSTDLDDLVTSRFERSKLYKKLVALMGETNFSTISKTSLIKRLTGEDPISFEFKNKTPFDDFNYAKIIIATNGLPYTEDKTVGFYRRWLIVNFPNTFTEEKDILAEIPEEEWEALLSKCVNILHNLLKARKFTNEGTFEEKRERYEEMSNPISKFIKENCKVTPDNVVPFFKLYDELIKFINSRGYRVLSKVEVSRILKRDGYDIKTTRYRKRDGTISTCKMVHGIAIDYDDDTTCILE